MARTPDLAGALEAIVTRTLKGTIGPKFRKLETQMRRLERQLRKVRAAGAAAGRKRGRKVLGRRRRGSRAKGRRSKR